MEPQSSKILNGYSLTDYLGPSCMFERRGTWSYTPPYTHSDSPFEEPEDFEDVIIRRSIEFHSKEGGIIPEFSFTGDKFGKISMWLKTQDISEKTEDFFKEQGISLGHHKLDFLGKTKHIKEISQIQKVFNILRAHHILPEDSYLKALEQAIGDGCHEINQQKESDSKQIYKEVVTRYWDASVDIPMRLMEIQSKNSD